MGDPFRGSASEHSRQKLRGKGYRRISRDLYVLEPAEPTLRDRVVAYRLVFPDGVPCLATAALLLKLPVDDDGVVHLARGRRAARSERPGLKVHRTPVEKDEEHDLDGLPVADGPRTFVDLAAILSFEDLVAVGDVVQRRWSADALAAAVERRPRRPGLALARRALPLLDGRADSAAESRARVRLHAAGFTALQHGVVVRDAGGGWLAEPDLADEAARVAVQHDGAVHFTSDRRRREQDVQRDELTRQQDWQVAVSTARDDRHPHLLVAKVTDAYRRAARLWGDRVLPQHLR
ncbi:MAG: hypothetical protein ACLGIG_05475 [Actinomycetes bacterium]